MIYFNNVGIFYFILFMKYINIYIQGIRPCVDHASQSKVLKLISMVKVFYVTKIHRCMWSRIVLGI